MAKRLISDAAAKRLIERLNRRMGAITVLTRDPRGIAWPAWLFQSLMAGLTAYLLMLSYRRWEYLFLSVTILALWTLMEVYNAGLNKRIDALVELLQQEGMLRREIPPDSVPED